jgi:hypothetical protein
MDFIEIRRDIVAYDNTQRRALLNIVVNEDHSLLGQNAM